MTEETKLKQDIKKYLRLKGWFVYHNLAGIGVYPGIADFVTIKDGHVVQIEVKAPKGRQSENQINFANEWTGHGGSYIVVHNLDEVMKI